MDSSRYEEDAANQLTPNSHCGKELLKKCEVLKGDIPKVMSKDKTKELLKKVKFGKKIFHK